MTADFPTIVYYLVTGIVILELLGAGLKKTSMAHLFLILRTCTCLVGIVYIAFFVGRPPLFGPFEAMVYIIFIMGILALAFGKNHGRKNYFFGFNSLVVLLILLSQTGESMALNDDYYMYTNIWVILFFNLRLLSAAFLAHGAAIYICIVFLKKEEDILAAGARNILLAGTCVYLASEWAGSLWCLNWFGDSWRWSHGFFKASILFLLVMAVCHLPAVIARNRIGRGIIGTLPGIFILWMIFFH
ncbi:MAG: hypothetical protein K8S13_01980 [Desulfobacula sp.]|uniref:hypothetical protein n=1 Tax=Desulfobacula sp. TaxID=2593537 RepID=UPI0025BFCF94|nr:hypothetical protein [Desulfobacula sp.]MCD4718615.1 hypothetical protein [Desulfobacula sp.]